MLACVCAVNGARGFLAGLWQLLLILSVMNLADRLGIDGWWVGHTKAWIIPGTEDLRPHITAADKRKKWMAGTVGMAVIAAVLAGIMVLLITAVQGVIQYFRHDSSVRLKLAEGIALALEFKLGGEVLRTVLARDWNELAILGAVIALRGALTMLLHWEIKNEKREHEHVLAK